MSGETLLKKVGELKGKHAVIMQFTKQKRRMKMDQLRTTDAELLLHVNSKVD